MDKKPAGPYELNPIRGVEAENFTDFRPKAPAQTAFEKHQQETAFTAEQQAEHDAKSDADELFGDREPQTAFELEARGGRRPLGATESAEPSLFDPVSDEGMKDSPVKTATAEKEKSTPVQPTSPPAPPSTSSPKSGPEKRSA